MNKWQIETSVSEDGSVFRLEIQGPEGERSGILYERPELEDLLRDLSLQRSRMSEPVPEDIDPGTRLEAQEAPHWRVRSDLWDKGPILLLRHPGYGWLSFAIPDDQAQEMAKCLADPHHPRQR